MNKKPEGMMPADKLPPLPEQIDAIAAEFIAEDWDDHAPGWYRNMDLLGFAAAIRAAALEEAAQACLVVAGEADAQTKSKFVTEAGRQLSEGMWGGASNCANAIRSL